MIMRGLTLPLRYTLLSLAILVTVTPAAAIDLPERRKDQFPTDSGYYLVPAPYSIPGLGEGFIISGSMMNVNHSLTDIYGFTAGGDLKGYGLFGTEIHLVKKNCCLT